MADERVKRRLAAIAVADVVGYSRMMEADEAGTLAALKERRKAILEPIVRDRGGRIVKLMGDGVLMEFTSAVNAVEAAVELQAKMAEANQSLTEHRRILLRIGINLGDVIGEGSDIYGDGVNVAARLEALAEPGGVCVSAKVHEELRGKGNAAFEDMGEVVLKNIVRPVRVYRVETSTGQVGGRAATTSAARPSIAVLPFDNLSGDPSQQYLSDGITEDITTELSRFKNLTVAARHASFHLARMGINPMQAARDLGANYVIEGSVRKAGERIRITAQLIDARTGNHVWAERYDRECHDIFAVQDEVVAAIVTTLEGEWWPLLLFRCASGQRRAWTAYDFFLQGRELADANMEKEAVPLFPARRRSIPILRTLTPGWRSLSSPATGSTPIHERCTKRHLPHKEPWSWTATIQRSTTPTAWSWCGSANTNGPASISTAPSLSIRPMRKFARTERIGCDTPAGRRRLWLQSTTR